MDITNLVGNGCYTSSSWNRDVCQMFRQHLGENRIYKDKTDFCRGVSFLIKKIVVLIENQLILKL